MDPLAQAMAQLMSLTHPDGRETHPTRPCVLAREHLPLRQPSVLSRVQPSGGPVVQGEASCCGCYPWRSMAITLDTALSLWDVINFVVVSVGGIIGFAWTKFAERRQEIERRNFERLQELERQSLERELAATRARLDQIDRVHSRRVQQLEALYGEVEHACWLCFGANPPAEIKGRPELEAARRAFREARIYLDESTAKVCTQVFGKCALVLSNAERLQAQSQPDALGHEWTTIHKAVQEGDVLRATLCSLLQAAIGAVPTGEPNAVELPVAGSALPPAKADPAR